MIEGKLRVLCMWGLGDTLWSEKQMGLRLEEAERESDFVELLWFAFVIEFAKIEPELVPLSVRVFAWSVLYCLRYQEGLPGPRWE